MKKGFVFALPLLLAPPMVSAGPIADMFGDGVFGMRWGVTKEEVLVAFPNAIPFLDTGSLRVRDDREILGIKRKRQHFHFNFDSSARLCEVVVYFDGGVFKQRDVAHAAERAFGPYTVTALAKDESPIDAYAATKRQWQRDGKISLTLVNAIAPLGSQVTLSIDSCSHAATQNKADLGF